MAALELSQHFDTAPCWTDQSASTMSEACRRAGLRQPQTPRRRQCQSKTLQGCTLGRYIDKYTVPLQKAWNMDNSSSATDVRLVQGQTKQKRLSRGQHLTAAQHSTLVGSELEELIQSTPHKCMPTQLRTLPIAHLYVKQSSGVDLDTCQLLYLCCCSLLGLLLYGAPLCLELRIISMRPKTLGETQHNMHEALLGTFSHIW